MRTSVYLAWEAITLFWYGIFWICNHNPKFWWPVENCHTEQKTSYNVDTLNSVSLIWAKQSNPSNLKQIVKYVSLFAQSVIKQMHSYISLTVICYNHIADLCSKYKYIFVTNKFKPYQSLISYIYTVTIILN